MIGSARLARHNAAEPARICRKQTRIPKQNNKEGRNQDEPCHQPRAFVDHQLEIAREVPLVHLSPERATSKLTGIHKCSRQIEGSETKQRSSRRNR